MHLTDYPIQELGDKPGELAPMRPCEILSYDGNCYCVVEVAGVELEIKSGYIYQQIDPGENSNEITC